MIEKSQNKKTKDNSKKNIFEKYKNSKKWISLDISTTGTGYSIYERTETGECQILKSGVIRKQGGKAKDRFPEMAKEILNIIVESGAEIILAEGVFFQKGLRSIEYLLKLHGVAEYAAGLIGIPYEIITTATWRSKCHFPCNLTKEKKDYKQLSLLFATELCGKEITDDNQADAICIGYAFFQIISSLK